MLVIGEDTYTSTQNSIMHKKGSLCCLSFSVFATRRENSD